MTTSKLKHTFYIQKNVDNRLLELKNFLPVNMPSAAFSVEMIEDKGSEYYPIIAKIELLYDIEDVGKLHDGLQKRWHKEGNG